ncbi:MAG: SurA N-terminal domain-containing protein [Endozoicomonadaceae bacterium]|nr:SurA N-terminal domain-containing protein [Endozoicomonadaceae bacterium]
MLQKMRDHTQGWITKVIIGIICFVFIIWGLETLITPDRSGKSIIAKVNGEPITQQQYYNQMQTLERNNKNELLPLTTVQMHKKAMDTLIKQALLLDKAKEKNLVVPEKDLDKAIIEMPSFHKNGHFNLKHFKAILHSASITPLIFKMGLRQSLLVAQEKTGVVNSAFMTDAQLEAYTILNKQTRHIHWAMVDFFDLEQKQHISDKEMKEYFDKHRSKFKTPEKLSVNYLVLDQTELAKSVHIPDADITTAYEDYVRRKDSEVQAKLAIILLKTDKKHTLKAQMEKAKHIKEELKKGAKFGDLAKKYSDDKKTADKKGYIGETSPGIYGDTFDNTVENLSPNQVSDPIDSKKGVILVKRVDDGKSKDVEPIAKMKDSLREELQLKRVPPLFEDKVQKLADVTFESPDLKEPAKELNLKIQTSDFFDHDGQGVGGIPANPAFTQAAFSDDVKKNNNNSNVIHISPTIAVVLHLHKIKPAVPRPMTDMEVKDQITEELKKEKTRKIIGTVADNIVKGLERGDSLDQVAKDQDVKWEEEKNATRERTATPPEVLQGAFELPHPEKGKRTFKKVKLGSGDLAVVVVTKVTPGSGVIKPKDKPGIRQALSVSKGKQDYEDMVYTMKSNAKIKILNKAIGAQE